MATYEVQLAIYDLSHGMARNLSAQFLGPNHAVDIVPHTAIVVFGREYFFGGGIQHQDPHVFRQTMGMHPIQILSLGHTSRSKAEFDAWCEDCMQSGRYSAASYDLLHHNCNNFSHDAALEGLQLSMGVPTWILDIPRIFLSSPMGQIARPILENMQVTRSPPTSATPWAAAPVANTQTQLPPPPTAAEAVNPWANLSAKLDKSPNPQIDSAGEPIIIATPILDSFTKPLHSDNVMTVPLCIKKLADGLDESSKETLNEFANIVTATNEAPSIEILEKSAHAVVQVLDQGATTNLSFALMLLRIIVLFSSTKDASEPSINQCLEWLTNNLKGGSNNASLLSGHVVRSMAWLCFSNVTDKAWFKKCDPTTVEELVDAAVIDLSPTNQPRPEVRQAAAAFLFNVAVSFRVEESGEMSDLSVSMLCSVLDDGIHTEKDSTTFLRRLLVVGRILKPLESKGIHQAARTLLKDLSFDEVLSSLPQSAFPGITGNDIDKAKKLAKELTELSA